MRRIVPIAIVAAVAAFGFLAVRPDRATTPEPLPAIASAPAATDSDARDAEPGELIVRFEPGMSEAARGRARASAQARLDRRLPVAGMELLALPATASPRAAAAQLSQRPGVAYAEPNFRRHALGTVDDRLFPYLWGAHNNGQTIRGFVGVADADVDAPEAWDVTTGDPATTVAVVDTGVTLDHPDLAPNLVGAERRWDYVDGDSDPTDLNGHGTHVAGTIAARGGDAQGIAGIAYGSTLMPLRVLDADGSGTVADVVSGYGFAAQHGAKIVNASLGSPSFSRAERDAIAASPGTLFVVAAGNGGAEGVGDDVDTTPDYPCAYDLANIVCVAATDNTDRLASFSNFGARSVDLAAPGVDILSTYPPALGGSWAWLDGTSMATPHAAGVAALVWSRFPEATPAQVREALLAGVDPKPGLAGKVATGGRLNANGALTAPLPAPAPATTTTPAPATTTPAPSADPAPAPPAPGQPAPAPAPAETTPAPTADTTGPVVALRAPRRIALSTLRSRGLRMVVSCSEACTIAARLPFARTRVVARTSRSLSSAGRTPVTLRLTRSQHRRLARSRVRSNRRLRLELAVRDRAGNRVVVRKRVLLRPR